jgi:hypothetical protein
MAHIWPLSPYIFPICADSFKCVKSSKSVLTLPPFRYRTPKSDRLLVLPYALARLATVAASAVRSAAINVLASNMVIVIGPTPPGTGVM